jgi:hypothetical protein
LPAGGPFRRGKGSMAGEGQRSQLKAVAHCGLVLLFAASAACAGEQRMVVEDGTRRGMSPVMERPREVTGGRGRRAEGIEADASRVLSERQTSAGRRAGIRWRHSRAVGLPWAGRLIRGVHLPAEGRHFFTWDPIRKRSPNRAYRRWGTDVLLRTILGVLDRYASAHPRAPRVAIGDLSRRHGGDFGKRFGGLGHSSHQNGLDVDVYYPRWDHRERAPRWASQIDRRLSQDLVGRFVRAGAQYVFVGPDTGLAGPPKIVQPLIYHNDHMHVRIRAR